MRGALYWVVTSLVGVAGVVGAIATLVRYIVRPFRDAAAAAREFKATVDELVDELRDLTSTFIRVVREDDARFRRLEDRLGIRPSADRTRRTDETSN